MTVTREFSAALWCERSVPHLEPVIANGDDELRTHAWKRALASPIVGPDVSPGGGHSSQHIMRDLGGLVIRQRFSDPIGCRDLGCGHPSAYTEAHGPKHLPGHRLQAVTREHPGN